MSSCSSVDAVASTPEAYYFICGFSLLFPYNCILASNEYYVSSFKGTNIVSISVFMFMLVKFLVQFFSEKLGNHVSYKVQVYAANLVNFAVSLLFVVVPLVPSIPRAVVLGFYLVLVFLSSMATSIYQNAINFLSGPYYTSLFVGIAASGVAASILKIATLYLFEKDYKNEALLFFSISCVSMFFMCLYMHLYRGDYLGKVDAKSDEENPSVGEDDVFIEEEGKFAKENTDLFVRRHIARFAGEWILKGEKSHAYKKIIGCDSEKEQLQHGVGYSPGSPERWTKPSIFRYFLGGKPATPFDDLEFSEIEKYYSGETIQVFKERPKHNISYYWKLVRALWKQELSILLSLLMTLAVFPAFFFAVKPRSSNVPGPLFSLIGMLLYNVGDLIGKFVGERIVILSSSRILSLACMRAVFILYFCSKVILEYSILLDLDFYVMALFLGISNGAVATAAFGKALISEVSRKVDDSVEFGKYNSMIPP